MSDMRDTNGVPDGVDADGDGDPDIHDSGRASRLEQDDADVDDAENLGLTDDDVDLAADGGVELRDP